MAETGELHLHPAIDHGIKAGTGHFAGGTLRCHCERDQVTVRIEGDIAYNHACGCTKCWKPEGAMFSVVAVVPRDKVKVTAHAEKLQVVDPAATIQRHACKGCGVHMFGRIESQAHPFYGFDFIHPELLVEQRLGRTGLRRLRLLGHRERGEAGADAAVRARLKELGLEPYDCLSPALMDAISTHVAKKAGVLAA